MNTNFDLNGIIIVNKPKGFTSFDVIAKMRGILRIKRIGHSGTLDPLATGVLPVLVGKATKASDILPVDEKSYIAGFKLGIVTDTQDITGRVLHESDKLVSIDELKAVTESFIGDIMQIPPMFSAVSVDGKRLYELAREGKVVERVARKRRVEAINIISYDESSREGIISVSVSKGTYVRTLIHDIGEKLGCGGTMTSLERTSSCGYMIDDCLTLEQIQKYADEDNVSKIIMPIESAFCNVYDKIKLNGHYSRLYKNGVKLRLEQVGTGSNIQEDTQIFCMYDNEDTFLGLAKADYNIGQLKIYKNFFDKYD